MKNSGNRSETPDSVRLAATVESDPSTDGRLKSKLVMISFSHGFIFLYTDLYVKPVDLFGVFPCFKGKTKLEV